MSRKWLWGIATFCVLSFGVVAVGIGQTPERICAARQVESPPPLTASDNACGGFAGLVGTNFWGDCNGDPWDC